MTGIFRLTTIFVLPCALCGAAAAATLRKGQIAIEYSPGDDEIARTSLHTLGDCLTELSNRLPAGDAPIQVAICRSFPQFRALAGAYAKARVSGVAKSERGLIVVKAPYLLRTGSDYRGILRHELIHVLLARNTNLANVPRWFNEGVAMVVSRELRWSSQLRVAKMYARGRVIPLMELNLAFAPLGNETVFGDAYAQALSMTQFLIGRIGEERFWDLIHALKTTDFDDALVTHADLTPGKLYNEWSKTLWKVALVASLVSGLGVFHVGALLVVLAYLRKRRRYHRILRQWEWQEKQEEVEGPTPYDWYEAEAKRIYPSEEEDDS